MAFERNLRAAVETLAAVAASAGLFYFGNGLEPRWPLVWLAPLPVLLLSLRAGWVRACAAAFGAALLGWLNMFGYLHTLGAGPLVWLVIFSQFSLSFAIGVLLFRGLARRGALWSAWLALPCLAVAVEYVTSVVSVHGTAGALAYSQLHVLAIMQLASVAGPSGVAFVVTLFPAGVALAWHFRQVAPRKAATLLAATLSVVAVSAIFGAWRLSRLSPGPHVRVGLVASDRPENDEVLSGAEAQRLMALYGEQARQLAARGAKLIVLPEKLVADPARARDIADAALQPVADSTGTTIVAGVVRVSAQGKTNQARVYTPHAAVQSYDKEHLLPPFESSLTPGRALLILPGSRIGIAICKDMDFASPSRDYGRGDVGLMLVPAWDFNVDRGWHGHIAILRGVENGYSLVRSAKNGYLYVSDDRGRILAETRSDAAPFATLVADVPMGHDATLYTRWGGWFAWTAGGLLLLSLCGFLRKRRPVR